MTIKAIYEDGVFKPQEPIHLEELTGDVARQLRQRKVSKDDVLKDFDEARRKRRAARCRR